MSHDRCCEDCHNCQSLAAERDRLKTELEKHKDCLATELVVVRDAWKQKAGEEKERADGNFQSYERVKAQYSEINNKAERLAELIMKKIAFKFTDPQGNLTELITMAQEVLGDHEK